MKKPIWNIAVTGLNAVDSPGPGIAVIRGLKESEHFDARIIGLAYETLEPGIYMRDLVDKVYLVPNPSAGHEALLQRLKYIHAQEKLNLVIPNFDSELMSYIKLQSTLKSMGIHSLLPSLTQFEERRKGKLNKYGEQYGISVPRSEEVLSVNDLKKTLGHFTYPMMVKGKFYEAYKAYSIEQAQAYFYKISAKWGTPIVIQQFIKGQEVNVTALGDGKGNMIGAVPMRKTYITDTGKGWAGVSINDPSLMEMTKKVIAQSKWAGGMELELIKEDFSGENYLIEINPRFPAWVYLSVGCGQNHPATLARIAMGEEVAPFPNFEAGKMFIRYSYDMICDLEQYAKISTTGEL